MRQHVPPILLCRATFSLKSGVFRNMHLRWRHILIERLRLGRGSTTGSTGQNFHDANVGVLLKGQDIPCPNCPCGLYSGLARNADLPPRHHPCGQRARFKKPRLPEPFIKANGVAYFAQPLLNPAKAAANGLSGSIFFSTFGFALNF